MVLSPSLAIVVSLEILLTPARCNGSTPLSVQEHQKTDPPNQLSQAHQSLAKSPQQRTRQLGRQGVAPLFVVATEAGSGASLPSCSTLANGCLNGEEH